MTHTGQGIVSKGSAVTCDYGVYLQSVKGQTLGMTSLGVLCPHARQLYAASFFGGESEHYITSPLASRASGIISCGPKQSPGYPAFPTELTVTEGLGDSNLIPDLSALGSLLKCDSQVKKEPLAPFLTH